MLFYSFFPFQSKVIENFWEENRNWTNKYKSLFQGWERCEAARSWRGLVLYEWYKQSSYHCFHQRRPL